MYVPVLFLGRLIVNALLLLCCHTVLEMAFMFYVYMPDITSRAPRHRLKPDFFCLKWNMQSKKELSVKIDEASSKNSHILIWKYNLHGKNMVHIERPELWKLPDLLLNLFCSECQSYWKCWWGMVTVKFSHEYLSGLHEMQIVETER